MQLNNSMYVCYYKDLKEGLQILDQNRYGTQHKRKVLAIRIWRFVLGRKKQV